MSKPLTVSIPHRLGKAEARRRLQAGLGNARTSYSHLFTLRDEVWTGDQLRFDLAALSQSISGTIDVEEDHVKLEVTLPWLLARLAERFIPAIQTEGTKMLEKK
jgi:hypothetical protein